MTFATTKLAGHRVLVEGTDFRGITGSTVLDGGQLATLTKATGADKAQADYDAAVKAFYAPLTDATDKLVEAQSVGETDARYIFEVSGPVEAVAGKAAVKVRLTQDSAVLRILENEGLDTSSLVWVNDELEIVE